MIAIVPAVLALAMLVLVLGPPPAALATLPALAPGPLLLGAALGGPRLALGVWLLLRVLGAAADGVAAALPPVPARIDTEVTGVVSEFPRALPGRLQFVLDVEGTAPSLPALRRVLVNWYDPPAAVPRPGERWQLTVRLRAPRGLANPGSFDYERWLFAQRIDATGYVRRDPGPAGRLGPATGPAPVLLRLRAAVAGRIAAAEPDPVALPYLLGLAVGVYQALPPAEWELLRRTGTVHIVSVSGFHLTLVALPLALAGGAGGVLLARLGFAVTPRVVGAVVALAGAAVYGGLAGFSVPTLRSLLMLAAVAACIAGRRGRPAAGLLALAAAAAVALEPLGLLTPGFWLSFIGVLALAAAFRGVVAVGPGVASTSAAQRVWLAVRNLSTAQLAAGVALLPLTLAWFGQVSVTGSLANFIAIPLFSFGVLPPILAGALVATIAPDFAAPLFSVATAMLALWRAILAWFASLPLSLLELPVPGFGAVALAAFGVLLALWPRPWPFRALAPACLLPLLVARPEALPPGGFAVTVVDVGQGLSVLVRTASHALLYDAGPAWGDADAGARAVVPTLRQQGIARLDRLIVSHGDIDHGGGANAVLAQFPEAGLLATQWPWPGDPVRRPCLAGVTWQWDGVGFRVLHPPDAEGRGGDNELSCVVAVTGAGGSLLLTGDIGARSEARLLAAGLVAPTDLVIAPHHGSRTSSSPGFVSALQPRFVVFTTGFANRWGFPRTDVVDRWRAAGACPLDTADLGALQFVARPGAGLRFVGGDRLLRPRAWRRPGSAEPCAPRSPARPVYSGAGLVAP